MQHVVVTDLLASFVLFFRAFVRGLFLHFFGGFFGGFSGGLFGCFFGVFPLMVHTRGHWRVWDHSWQLVSDSGSIATLLTQGLVPLEESPNETSTRGLEGLHDACTAYHKCAH